MERTRITLPPITAPGEVTTFYSFESGTARSVALSNTAVLLAGRDNATTPVLMIDWDTESPGLHHTFGRPGEHPGLLEYFEACRAHLQALGPAPAGADDIALARCVLEAVDWEPYVERVDQSRPLYLMRAGRFDDSYGERADRMDWDGLFAACPALFRCFAEHLGRQFRHVLVDARSGRSAAVSVCTALLPTRLVTLFTPNQRSLDGLAGVVLRAIDYRRTHEEAQRPLLVYPLPSSIDSADCERRIQWRRGDPQRGVPGYQPVLEKLLRQCYGLSQLSLDSYFNEVQLQQTNAMSGGEHVPAMAARDADRFSLARTFDTLLAWLAEGRFPWQSLEEVRLTEAIASARARLDQREAGEGGAVSLPLAADLCRLGVMYREQGRQADALRCFEESLALRQQVLGDEHADTRRSRIHLAALLQECGKLPEASFLHELLAEDCQRLLGADHPDTLAARQALAATLAALGEYERALALHDRLIDDCERLSGPASALTLGSLAGLAATLAGRGELSRARMVYERVLEGRERLLGAEHADTVACARQLAQLLYELGDLDHARKLQEGVVAARDRHLGREHRLTLAAREELAEILAAQSDIDGVRKVLEVLASARERSLGPEHPDTLSIQLRLASILSDYGNHGDLDAARRLQQQLLSVHERLHGADDLHTLTCKKALAATLSRQGHSLDARKLEESVVAGSARLGGERGLASGPHASHGAASGLRASILDAHDGEGQADTLGHKLAQLQQLIDNRSEREARELADSLRHSVLRPNAANPLRLRGVAMIRQVYLQDNDKDALLSFAQDEVSSLQEALKEVVAGRAATMS